MNTFMSLAVVVGIVLSGGLNSAAAEEMTDSSTLGGTGTLTGIDLWPQAADGTPMPDGVRAGLNTGQESSDLFGPSTFQLVVEQVPIGPTAECPGGAFVIDADNGGSGSLTHTFQNGDQIYGQVVAATQCIDAMGRFSGTNTVSILGGSGEFVGLTGSREVSFTGFIQIFDPAVRELFGSFTATATTVYTFPDGDDDEEEEKCTLLLLGLPCP